MFVGLRKKETTMAQWDIIAGFGYYCLLERKQ